MGKEIIMPAHVFAILIGAVLCAAAGTVFLAAVMGWNPMWLGLIALMLSMLVRKLKW
jgi:hypothetical protein